MSKIITQTFTFNRKDKERFFRGDKQSESVWDFNKRGLGSAIQIIDDCTNEDFEVIIRAKELPEDNAAFSLGEGKIIFGRFEEQNFLDKSSQSEVEKAKEELSFELRTQTIYSNDCVELLSTYKTLVDKAQNLLNALDSQKEPELRDKKSCLSERETKLPWKDVSELPAIDFKAMIDLARYHLREIRSDTVGKPRDIPNAVESLTNIVESMLSRQEELENLIRKPSAEGKPSCVDWSFIYDSGLTPEQILICELMIQRQDELEARVRKLEGK